MTICKQRWYGGNPTEAYQAPFDEVMNAFHFQRACDEYETAYMELNKDKK